MAAATWLVLAGRSRVASPPPAAAPSAFFSEALRCCCGSSFCPAPACLLFFLAMALYYLIPKKNPSLLTSRQVLIKNGAGFVKNGKGFYFIFYRSAVKNCFCFAPQRQQSIWRRAGTHRHTHTSREVAGSDVVMAKQLRRHCNCGKEKK